MTRELSAAHHRQRVVMLVHDARRVVLAHEMLVEF